MKNKRTVQKHSLTLLEILISVVLVALIAGLFGFRFYGRRQQFFFLKNVEKIREKLAFAQKMALFAQRDFAVLLQADKGSLFLQVYPAFQPEKPVSRKTFSPLYFCFIAAETQESKQTVLLFSPGGSVYPEGTLRLSAKKDFSELQEITF